MAADLNPITIFLIAGEPSGDALAAKLMQAFAQKTSGQARFHGVGGPLMQAEGLKSLFPMEELTVMGVAEVLPKLPNLLKRISDTANEVKRLNPDVFISVDAPDFSFRVAKKLRGSDFPKVHYVAPSVWAWRPGRAKKIAPLYDHLLTILPFEPPYFEKVGLPATFVGHSVVETGADAGNGPGFRSKYGIAADEKLLMMLPGSRRGEVSRHLPIFEQAMTALAASIGPVKLVVPVIGKPADIVKSALATWDIPSVIIEGEAEKYDAMAAADVALAASGTVGLELALARLPTVIAYKMNPVTVWIGRRLVKLEYANLVNILLNREVVPEKLFEDCTPEILAGTLAELFRSPEKCQQQIDHFHDVMIMLGQGGAAPGARAADVVLDLIQQKEKK